MYIHKVVLYIRYGVMFIQNKVIVVIVYISYIFILIQELFWVDTDCSPYIDILKKKTFFCTIFAPPLAQGVKRPLPLWRFRVYRHIFFNLVVNIVIIVILEGEANWWTEESHYTRSSSILQEWCCHIGKSTLIMQLILLHITWAFTSESPNHATNLHIKIR